METHNIALTALNKIEAHAEECTRRQTGIDKNQAELKADIADLGKEVKSLNYKAAFALGGLIVVGKIFDYVVQLHSNGAHL